MDLSGLIDLVANQRMYLTQVMAWPDLYETDALREVVKFVLEETDLAELVPTPAKSSEVAALRQKLGSAIVEHTAKSVYAQCWTRREDSDAMWRIYSPDKRGVRLGVDRAKVRNAIQSTFQEVDYCEVEYVSSEDARKKALAPFRGGKGSCSIASLCRFKRPAFDHEHEHRFCLADTSVVLEIRPDDAVSMQRDLQLLAVHAFPEKVYYEFNPALVDEVTLDPRLDASRDQWFFETIRSICAKNAIDVAKIDQSELYRRPGGA